MATGAPVVVIQSEAGWQRLQGFRRIHAATARDDVLPVLRSAEADALTGKVVAGFVAYEAAPAFDSALAAHTSRPLPLAWFAVFDDSEKLEFFTSRGSNGEEIPAVEAGQQTWHAALDQASYARKIDAIRAAIARGETYQVNLTFPLASEFAGDAQALFKRLAGSQQGKYAAFIETEDFAICSASPELFFELDGGTIRCRPMKGTAMRGRWSADDEARADELHHSEKNRAENLMIVDMVRNDLGRVAETGTIRTVSLFDIERYPTVLQMTSTIEAKTKASVTEIFRALFPSASITGAPKVRTSKIIAQHEPAPRGIYCGAIGIIGPGDSARFNVAIRTVQINKRSGIATFGTGSGIVWDSNANSEYAECLTKAAILEAPPAPEFQLLETLRFDFSNGWKFLERHLARLAASAHYFGRPCDRRVVAAALDQAVRNTQTKGSLRVRVLLDSSGRPNVHHETQLLPGFFEDRPVPMVPFIRAAISNAAATSRDVILFHKTTHRIAYERAKAACPGVEEALLVNERGELTEGTIGNIVLNIGTEFLTPPLDCGLLPGVFREELLARGAIREAVLTPHDMMRASGAYLINSVRGWSRLAMR